MQGHGPRDCAHIFHNGHILAHSVSGSVIRISNSALVHQPHGSTSLQILGLSSIYSSQCLLRHFQSHSSRLFLAKKPSLCVCVWVKSMRNMKLWQGGHSTRQFHNRYMREYWCFKFSRTGSYPLSDHEACSCRGTIGTGCFFLDGLVQNDGAHVDFLQLTSCMKSRRTPLATARSLAISLAILDHFPCIFAHAECCANCHEND